MTLRPSIGPAGDEEGARHRPAEMAEPVSPRAPAAPRAAAAPSAPAGPPEASEPVVLQHLRGESTSRERTIAEISVVLVMLCWGVNVVAVKAAIGVLPPIGFAFLRFSIAFALMLAFLRLREGSVAIPRREILPLLGLGLAGFGVYQDLWATALRQTTAANSALITSATPIPTMLIAVAISADVFSRRKLAGALISLAGVAAVVFATHGFALSGAGLGDLVTVVATVSWACYVAFGAPILARHSALRAATWATGFGCLGMLPFAIPQLATVDFSHVPASAYGQLLFSAVLSAAVSNVVMFAAVRVLGPSRVTLFQFFVPVFAVTAAFVFLGEPLVIGQVVGGAIIVVGILVARSQARGYRLRRAAVPPAVG